MGTATSAFRDIKIATPSKARPLLKWAGGKGQLLEEIKKRSPRYFGKYIEPFFGGGALFFDLKPQRSVISDNNPELVNLYKAVANDVGSVINELKKYKNTKEYFYAVRQQDWEKLSPAKAAARTIYLNKTCFNGLYRVNKEGKFNVPYGNYSNPRIYNSETLVAASILLNQTSIIHGDFKEILKSNAQPGDFVFLDPPYLPVSEYSDFKRYTREQFYEEDHIELADEVKRLHELGCYVILTNSNHPIVHELYKNFHIEVVQTRRSINSNSAKRKGEDVIVTAMPKKGFTFHFSTNLHSQVSKFPPTRFMGSKRKLLKNIWEAASKFNFDSVLDLFSGSNVVAYMFKAHGKKVLTNDHMAMSAVLAKALISNNIVTLPKKEAELLLVPPKSMDNFVSKTFKDLYFTDEENKLIDILRNNIQKLSNPYKKAIALSALIRACLKKRPRGIFTYTGLRYDDGRRDLQLSFNQQFLNAVEVINRAVFDNGKKNEVRWGDAMEYSAKPDLVYIDPPYFSTRSDNEYVRRYHFVEGLARDWKGVEIQNHTTTKKFKSYPTPFSSRKGAVDAFDRLFYKYRNSILIVSYSSNSLPALDEMVSILSKHKKYVDVISIDHKYSFGNQNHKIDDNRNSVKEYLFVGY